MPWEDPGWAAVALVAAALFTGALLNALVGFGFALITVPMMAIAVGAKDAVVLSAILGLISNGGVLLRHRGEAEWPVARRMVVGSLVGMPVGLAVLVVVPATPLKAAIGVVVVLSVGILARGWVIHDPPPGADVATGVVSGLLNTSVGVSGPPVVMNLAGRSLPKAPFRATAVAVFATAGVVALLLFVAAGRITAELMWTAAVALPAWPLGWVVGDAAHRRFDEDRFRGLVLVLLALTGAVTVLSALVRGPG